MTATSSYQTRDQLFLWWVADPARPVFVGELAWVRSSRGVSLRYSDEWCTHGFALSEDLPLLGGHEFMPRERDTAAGAVDDARPDRWGERVIRFLDKPPRLSLLEYLYFAGDDRFGALGVSTSASQYLPRRLGALPTLADTEAISELVRKVLDNEPVEPALKRLISPGVTLGGARPKALLDIDGDQWVVKFADGEAVDLPLVEHAAMSLAALADIRAAPTRAIRLAHGHALAVRRFDRAGGRRLHALSANVALKAAGETLGYPELAQLLRRRGSVEADRNRQQMRELFRRMVFNILIDNTDDHEKNHALLVTDEASYELSPAYDVLPSAQGLGYQQLRVGVDAGDSTLDNALSMSAQFGLTRAAAQHELSTVAAVVARWREHFASAGVSAGDIELLGEHIDRPFLREQRDAYAKVTPRPPKRRP
jgi:serine/threonine-protein kinase HipA